MAHRSLSPMPTPPLHSHHASFPIIAVAIIGILATGLLLVSYYVFVIKCCLNWHRIDLLRRFSFSRRRRVDDPLPVYSPAVENRGLDEAVIRSIPVFQYKKEEGKDTAAAAAALCECAVCLNEFQETEKLRMIPNCAHIFHIDCIDVWLQSNANCPLCRNSISSATTSYDKIMIAPSTTPQDPILNNPSTDNDEDDYVVIEISTTHDRRNNNNDNTNQSLVLQVQERLIHSGEPKISRKKAKNFSHVSSFGDECIDIRHKDEQFAIIQPIRRSFSMDSAADRQLYLAVQEIVQQQSSISEVKRSFFSFGHGRGSRNAVQPVHLEP